MLTREALNIKEESNLERCAFKHDDKWKLVYFTLFIYFAKLDHKLRITKQ